MKKVAPLVDTRLLLVGGEGGGSFDFAPPGSLGFRALDWREITDGFTVLLIETEVYLSL